MAKNGSLNKAGINKEDEFYTKLTDIEKEMRYYREHFKDKIIFCNCDDPEESNFWKYFELNFDVLGLKKLVSTHFETDKPSYKLEIIGDINGDGKTNKYDIIKTTLRQNGDFRSPECIEIMKEADIIITNPPFSLYREYINTLIEYKKKFIILASQNSITYKEVFTLLKENKIWLGKNAGDMEFVVPSYYEPRATRYREENGIKYRSFGNMCWMTNLELTRRNEELILYKKYTPENYPMFDNYDAIFVDKVENIPIDYDGVMGVPITFLSKHNPEQFKIIGLVAGNIKGLAGIPSKIGKDGPYINGKLKYGRIFIKKIKEEISNED